VANLLPTGNYYTNYSNTMVVGPTPINPWSTLTISAWKRGVQFLSENLASFELSVCQNDNPVTPPHPLQKILRRKCNKYQNSFIMWQTLFGHMIHRGNGYLQVERGSNFQPIALNNLLPEDIAAVRVQFPDTSVEQFYVHTPTKQVLPGSDVIHLRFGVSHDGMIAMDPIALHERTMQRAATIEQFQTMYLARGTNIRGVISFPQSVTAEQVAEIQNTLKVYFNGADAQQDVLTLSDGAKFDNVTLSPKDSELSLQESNVTKQIAQILGLHPYFLFDDPNGKYNGSVESAGEDVVRFTFRVLIEQIESELTMKLLSETEQDLGYEIKLDPEELLRGDFKTLNDIAVTTTAAGLRSRNDGRAMIGLPPDKDPESDKLKTAGDTSVPGGVGTPPILAEKTNKPAPALPAPATAFAALTPLITAACERVDQKTEKAFGTHSKKPDQERTIWANVFSGEQQKFAADALRPVSEALVALGGAALDVDRAAERYASGIRKRAATGESVTLTSILKEMV
jgi:HK97 family phage portal protein